VKHIATNFKLPRLFVLDLGLLAVNRLTNHVDITDSVFDAMDAAEAGSIPFD